MRRSSLSIVRCPRCHGITLQADGAGEQIRFGPAHCTRCAAVFPLAEGILDIGGNDTGAPISLAQRLMESRIVARAYERTVRPLFAGLDQESEQLLLRSLLGLREGETLLDLSCGSGLHVSRLSQDVPGARIIGLDRSAPMLLEAAHHLTDARANADLIRGDAADLPFGAGSIDAVLNVASLHLYPDPGAVLRQVARVLRPGGRFVCAALLPERLQALNRIEARAGVRRYDEEALRALCESAGLLPFERIRLAPWIVFRVSKAA